MTGPGREPGLWAIAAAALLIAAPALADPPAIPEACRSKTDGCQVCSLDDGKVVACSLPGIACAKGQWHCNEQPAVPPLPEPHAGPEGPDAGKDAAPAPSPAPTP